MRPIAELPSKLLICLAAAAASLSAPAWSQPSRADGVYIADLREAPPELHLSSSIELRPDGRFDWRLTMGDVALSAQGEWSVDGDMIHLDNPEQVGEPAVELVSSTSDESLLLSVVLEPATARMAPALEVELEYPGNSFSRIEFEDGRVELLAADERPIAVRLTSQSLSLRTQPIEVPAAGDNVLTLRLIPADLGQAFFASQQRAFDDRGMTLDWAGFALRYDRAPVNGLGD